MHNGPQGRNTPPLPRGGRAVMIGLGISGFVLGVLLVAGSATYAQEQPVGAPSEVSWWDRVTTQLAAVYSVARETTAHVFAGAPLQIAQVGTTAPPPESDTVVPDDRTRTYVPSGSSAGGTLIINAPLELSERLRVRDRATLATTTINGALTAASSTVQSLRVREAATLETLAVAADTSLQALVVADTTELGTLTVGGESSLGTLTVRDGATMSSLEVSELATLQDVDAPGRVEVGVLRVREDTELAGLLTASGGIETDGADIDLGDGSLFAANVVNEVIAGDNVTISGTQNEPIISVDTDDLVGVLSINDETGELDLRGTQDIQVNGLRIRNTSDLSTVRARGGCSGCITDSDVRNNLTIAGGVINATPIGSSTPASARFTDVSIGTSTSSTTLDVGGAVTVSDVLTVSGNATSTFAGSVNLTDGCFAIDGECLEGLEPSSYVGLTDTPSSLLSGALQFANGSGDALIQSADLVFTGGNLGVGTSTPTARLSVVGDTLLAGRLDVVSSTSAQFAGGINITDGCVAVDGTCIAVIDTFGNLTDVAVGTATSGELVMYDGSDWVNAATSTLGLGDGSFRGLTDTPSGFTAQAVPYVNAAGDALTQSSDFVFDGTRLALGTSSPIATLTVAGDLGITGAQTLRWYDGASSAYVGFRAPGTLGGTTVWTLPGTDGAENEILVTDGSGNLSFESLSSIGEGATTYLELLDTPSQFATGSIPYVNASSTELTQSSSFVFQDDRLGLGVSDPTDTLMLEGTARIQLSSSQLGMTYGQDGHNRFGFGTEDPVDMVTVQNGSITQRGGSVGDTYTPAVRTSMALPSSANDIDVAGNYAYVVTSSSGDDFHVIDITNRLSPVEVSSLDLPTSARSVTVRGQYAYVTTDFSAEGFHVIDISNPLDPVEVASLDVSGNANDHVISGRYAYVGVGSSVRVVDISNPHEPTEIAVVNVDDTVQGVAVSGSYVYVTTSIQDDDFHVIDIDDPPNPVEVSSLPLPDTAKDVAVRGGYAYVATNADGDDFHVIDISVPTTPAEVASINMDTAANDIFLTGRYAYVVTQAAGSDFHVIDINDPLTPVEIGSADPASGNGLGLYVSGRYAFMVSSTVGNEFHVIDVSGAEMQSAMVHSLEGGALTVQGDGRFGGRVDAGLGLRSGREGLQTDGSLSVFGLESSHIESRLSIGTTTAEHTLTVGGDLALFGALRDASGAAGAAGEILQSTGSGTEWVATSTLGLAGGGGSSSFLDLTDTPATYGSNRLLFTTSGSDGVTDSADLTYDGTNLSVGAANGFAFGGVRYLAADNGNETVMLGVSAGASNLGLESVLVGDYAGEFNQGDYATLVGYGSGGSNLGDYVVSMGYLAGYSNEGAYNILIGNAAGTSMSGSFNLALGSEAGYQADGNYNAFIGHEAGRNLQGTSSTLVGSEAFRGLGSSAFTAEGNVALGYRAGYTAETSASRNVFVGYQAGSNVTTGSNNIVLGYDLALAAGTQSGAMTLGNLIFGTGLDGTGTTTASGNVGIGTSTPSERLTVAGTIRSSDLLGGSTNLTTDTQGNIIRDPSDERLKENIETIDNALEVVLGLRGVRYEWIDEHRFGAGQEIGFIAQEVQQILPEVVRDGGEYWSLNTRNIVAVVVEAIKELWEEVRGTQREVADLKAQVNELETRLNEQQDGGGAADDDAAPAAEAEDGDGSTTTENGSTTTPESETGTTANASSTTASASSTATSTTSTSTPPTEAEASSASPAATTTASTTPEADAPDADADETPTDADATELDQNVATGTAATSTEMEPDE